MSGEKRSKKSDDVVRAETTILLDIEGTTTSLNFIKDTLFPYIQENLKQYVNEKWDQEEFKGDLENLKEQAKKDQEAKVAGFVPISGITPEEEKESLVKNVLWQMNEDRKTGALKQLQGHMWRQAYESGAVKGHVYEDVPKALESWTAAGKKIYIYSSGSVQAQKLLFSHSQSSDLTKYLSDYFDTEMGAKVETDSYKKILSKLNVAASSVLFLTDVVKEAQAAREAGIATTIVVRVGNTPLSEEEKSVFSTITSFEDLAFQSSSKRQKIDTSEDKKDIAAEKLPKKEINSKTEVNDMSETDSKAESLCEPMDTSDDILDETDKKAETAKPGEKESKVKVEAEQKEKENTEVPIFAKEELKKSSTEDSKEKSTVAKIAEPKVKPTIAQGNKDEEMVVDEPDKIAEPQEFDQKVETPANEKTKQILPEEQKGTETESSKAEDSVSKPVPVPESKAEDKKMPESKPETEVKSDSSEKDDQPEFTEEKVELTVEATEEKAIELNEENNPEPKTEKIPEIVVEKALEVEAVKEKVPVLKENGGVSKVEEAKDEETNKIEQAKEAKEESKPEVQPELRSEKEEEKIEDKKEAPEKVNETEKTKEVENRKAIENGKADGNAKAERLAKEEEHKLNGTSNSEKKHSNVEEKQINGVDDKEKSDSKYSIVEENQSNGIDDKEKSDSKSMEATSSQNGDTETSETSESIKVKKLVDSTVPGGATEPELVTPPVGVVASS